MPQYQWRHRRIIGIVIVCVLAALTLVGIYFTRQPETLVPAQQSSSRPAGSSIVVDESPLLIARSLLPLASTHEEEQLAMEAIRQADHEVDLAYTMALRRARLQPPPQTPQIKTINDQIHSLENQLKSDESEIARLDSLLKKPGISNSDDLQDQLELAQAQRSLHEEELEDAHQDLIAAGGDNESLVQQKYKEHESLQHTTTAPPALAKPAAFEVPSNLLKQMRVWQQLRQARRALRQAQKDTENFSSDLSSRSQKLSQRLRGELKSIAPTTADSQATANKYQRGAALTAVRAHVDWRRVLADYSRRISDAQQLSGIYGQWAAIVTRQMTISLNAILRSVMWVLLIILTVFVVEILLERHVRRLGFDRRSSTTMRMIFRITLRAVGVLLALIVIFGPPTQLSTIVAFAGAGLTVALKDFIVAFFGWFVLMGRNGIHVGDWVEIEGIGGEVIEIGLLRTVLMETGNWNDTGHPTGRKVAFVNSFAMEKHYFNFTTKGQWLWDELNVLVPAGMDPSAFMSEIQKLVTYETKASATLAEQEWQHATHDYNVQSFSAAPAINIRPSGQGISVVVRYVTQANERYILRTRLYKGIVDLMRNPEIVGSAPKRTT